MDYSMGSQYFDSATKYWVSDKFNFSIKMETQGISGTMSMEYLNIQEKTFPAFLFDILEGFQKMFMPMMAGMFGQ